MVIFGMRRLWCAVCVLLIIAASNAVEKNTDSPLKHGSLKENSDAEFVIKSLISNLNETKHKDQTTALKILKNFQYFVAPGLAANENSRCREDSQLFWNELQKGLQMDEWAVKMFESSSSIIPWGMFIDNAHTSGHYSECLRIETQINRSKDVMKGRHCRLHLSINASEPGTRDFYGLNKNSPSLETREAFVEKIQNLTRSVCVPDSCTIDDVKTGTNKFLKNFFLEVDKYQGVCSETQTLGKGTKCMIVILGLVVCLVAGFTILDIYIREQLKARKKQDTDGTQMSETWGMVHQLTPVFSAVQGIQEFITVEQDELNYIHGLSFLSRSWITLGRQIQPVLRRARSKTQVFGHYYQWMYLVLVSWPLGIDVFFFFSAFLTAISFYKKVNGRRSLEKIIPVVLKGYVDRYLSLAPLYLWVIAIFSTSFYNFGDGPYWQNEVKGAVKECKSGWWTNMLYVNNLFPGSNCLPDTEYSSYDMQFYILAPILLIPLYMDFSIGAVLFVVSFVISFGFPLLLHIYGSMSMVAIFVRKSTAYITGLMCGYLYHNKPRIQMTRVESATGWCVAILFTCIAIFGGLNEVNITNGVYIQKPTFLSHFQQPLLSLVLFWVVFSTMYGHGGAIVSLLSASCFVPFGKIMYCAFLISGPVQMWVFSSKKETSIYEHATMMANFLGTMFLIYFIALLFHIFLQRPTNGVIQLLIKNTETKKQKIS